MKVQWIVCAVAIMGLAVCAPGAWGAGAATAPPLASKPQRPVDFNRDIRPILSENCYQCHGPDKNNRKADLRLDTKEGLFGIKDDVAVVAPKKVDDSLLYMRITSDDSDFVMPKTGSNKHLTQQQKDLFKRWIAEGAPWAGHWAYTPPVAATLPSVQIPGFAIRNPIDNFIGARLNEVALKPSPEADRATLLRRLSFDLTGLPPTAEEVDAFVHDPSPDAYEKQVDRLLASPHYGERMATFWLDLVRYADTIGYHSDNPREIWPYRDWVIKAFNQDEPFNQFTIEQIAGDLIPGATRDQKVASGYNRLLLTTGEGGAQAKEYVVKYEDDRVRNVSSVWMGATMACCQCHDHKFDPYTQKDFYRMAAFFADIQEPAIALPQPELLLPTPEQQKQLDALDSGIAKTRQALDTGTPQLAAAQSKWEEDYRAKWSAEDAAEAAVKWTPLIITQAKSAGGATLTVDKDGATVLASGANPPTDSYTIQGKVKLKNVTAIRIDALPDKSLPGGGPGRFSSGNFVLSELDAAIDKGAGPTTQPIAFDAASASFEQTSGGEVSPYRKWPAQAAIDGDKFGPTLGWAIAPQFNAAHYAIFETAADLGKGRKNLQLSVTMKFNFGQGHAIGHFRLSATDSPRPVHATPDKGLPANIVALIQTPVPKRSAVQSQELAKYFRGISPLLQPARDQLASLTRQRQEFIGGSENFTSSASAQGKIARTLISVSGPPRVVRVLHRGDWQDDTGEIVSPGVPMFLRQIQVPVDRGASRLDLANWLVARDNPMTARCFVNRLWKMFYGEGIAKPLDDLGSQGQWPTHPELLDYLAVKLMDSGWDVKQMVRMMVTSSTYRQSSVLRPDLKEKDPYNKYVARQGSFRLDAEFVRDNALSVAGLLSPKMFGPSVKPYQPAGYWIFLNFPKRKYNQDHGESLYRRGLYTWWQRTFLNPELLNFDAPSHEECVAERTRSNTPQQALTLLNDPTFVEAARVFAARIMRQCSGDDQAKITWAFRQALDRAPTAREMPVLTQLLDQQRQRYRFDVQAAEILTNTGESPAAKGLPTTELAAWTSVSRTILNLHETITRD
jgi:hypothetical protein